MGHLTLRPSTKIFLGLKRRIFTGSIPVYLYSIMPFMSPALSLSPESIHPTLWCGAQRARATRRCIDTGHPELTAELPGGGWPQGAFTELLVQQPGIGELRLLVPALRALGSRPVMLINPPHLLQPLALGYWGLASASFCMLHAPKTADALWAAEQALRADSCGAVLLWQCTMRAEALRRLSLAAQHGQALCFLLRPLSAALNASPALLRLTLTPASAGVQLTLLKRRGSPRDEPLCVPLSPCPILLS